MIPRDYAKPSDDARRLAETYGVLPYMAERYIKMLGVDEAEEFLKSTLRPPRRSVRCNTLKVRPEVVVDRLTRKGFKLERIPWTRWGYWVSGGLYSLGATTEYLMGYYHIQGAASMLPAEVLSPKPSDKVIDMCAAPGSKTSQLAQIMGNEGVVVAVEKSRARMRALRSNLSRLGATNVIMVRADVLVIARRGLKFDKTLLDAPCSGEGLLAVCPERRTSRSLDDLHKMMRIQMELLRAARELTDIGGYIVYSTCSIAPEENEFVIASVLREGGLEVVDTGLTVGEPGFTEVFGVELDESLYKCRRLYPHKHGTEGFFVCKLLRVD